MHPLSHPERGGVTQGLYNPAVAATCPEAVMNVEHTTIAVQRYLDERSVWLEQRKAAQSACVRHFLTAAHNWFALST